MRTNITLAALVALAATAWTGTSSAATSVATNTSGSFIYNTMGYRGVSSLGTLGYIGPTGDNAYLGEMRRVFDAQESILRAAFNNPRRTDLSLRSAVNAANRTVIEASSAIIARAAAANAAAAAATAKAVALAEQQKAATAARAALVARLESETKAAPATTDAADLRKAQSDELKTISAFSNFKPLNAQFARGTVSALYNGKATASSATGHRAEGSSNLFLNITTRRFAGVFGEFIGAGCSSMNAQKCQDFASKLNFTSLSVEGMVTPNGFVYRGNVKGTGASGAINGLFRAAGAEGVWTANVDNRLGTTGSTIANSQVVTGTWSANPVATNAAAPAIPVVAAVPAPSVSPVSSAPAAGVKSTTAVSAPAAPTIPAAGAFSSWAGTPLSNTLMAKKDLLPQGYTPSDSRQALYSGTTTADVTNLHDNTKSKVTGEVKLSVNITQGKVTGAIGNFVGSKDSDTANFLNAGNVVVAATVTSNTSYNKDVSGNAVWTPTTAKAAAARGSFSGTVNRNSSTLAGDGKGSWGIAGKDFTVSGTWSASTPAVRR